MSERLDKALVTQGLLKTRSQASMLIKQGDIFVNDKKELKGSKLISDSDVITVKTRDFYVGRGALKLIHALEAFELNLEGRVIADCGASTGGFTEVALKKGANKVYAIDVGHGQLDETLKMNSRVENYEGINLKHEFSLPEKVDFCVVDLSFISLKLTFKTVHSLLKANGRAVVLIKPQFEAGRERLGKNGIVRDEYIEDIIEEVKSWLKENDFIVEKIIDSPIQGKTGNKEFLALIT